jgi:hypothetical protein
MTTPTSDEPFPPQRDLVQEQPPAFEGQATFELTKAVELSQLAEELTKVLKRQVQLAQMGPDSGWVPSPDNPATLAITPGDVNRTKVEKAIADHQPIAGYDVPERERQFSDLVNRLQNDPDSDLSDDDVRVAVRALVLREAGRMVGGPL